MVFMTSRTCFAYLLTLTTTHVRGLSTLVVNVSPKVLEFGLGRSLGLLNCFVDFGLGLLIDSL